MQRNVGNVFSRYGIICAILRKNIGLTPERKVQMNQMITAKEAGELAKYVHRKAEALSRAGGRTPLSPARTDELEARLMTLAVKAIARHDPAKAPLVPFVKSVVSRSAYREVVRVFARQMALGECSDGDLSLDVKVSEDPGCEETYLDLLPEDGETVARRESEKDMEEQLSYLDWREQMALASILDGDHPKAEVAAFFGISRPTLDKLIRKVAKKLFTSPTKSADCT